MPATNEAERLHCRAYGSAWYVVLADCAGLKYQVIYAAALFPQFHCSSVQQYIDSPFFAT